MPEPRKAGHELVCLVCVRNREHDLPGWLESVSHFADAIVVLDDGSTDATSDVLRRHSLVKVQLRNPRRESDSGGDETANWNRLLEAAGVLRPRWALSLDVDERIPADEGGPLREFLRRGAIRGAAYGFRMHRAGDARETHGDGQEWGFRLFSYRKGQRFPRVRPREAIVPIDIPREHWIRTTLSVQQGRCLAGTARPAGLAVVEDRGQQCPASRVELQRGVDEPLDPNRPVLSAIVISQNDRGRIEEVMDSLMAQEVDQSVEFILVNSGRDGTAEFVRGKYPQVRVVHLPDSALPGKARNAGLDIAEGDFVTFSGSHIVLPPGTLQKRIDAHENGYAMVCGAILNGTDTRAGWASYFLDHAGALGGRPSTVLRLPPSRCSYLKGPLTAIGGFPEDRRVGEDTVVNARLYELGYRAYHSRDVQCVHRSPCSTPARLLRHHFDRGLGFGRILWERAGQPLRFRSRGATILWVMTRYPVRRMRFITEAVHDWGKAVRRQFVMSLPLVLAGVASAAAGAVLVLLRPRPADARTALPVSRNRKSGSWT